MRTAQPFRLPGPFGHAIDRERTLPFAFDGQRFLGHPGDTLASALLANGVHLAGRSFRYHRPRGILSAGSEEPNALVQLRLGARSEPNVRAPVAELFAGLEAESQNCWPSLGLDLGAVAGAFSRLFPAGFYYKTFMGPLLAGSSAKAWLLYEGMIRRAAGLGRAPDRPDPDRYERLHAHCDVLVVGAGPAGLAAALAAARTGAETWLVDERAVLGGALHGIMDALIEGRPSRAWSETAVDELMSMRNVRVLTRTTATGFGDQNMITLCERAADHRPEPALGAAGIAEPRQRLWRLRAGQVVLATGAIERPLCFADNDRPGIMLAEAARRYALQYGALAGKRAVVFTSNDDAYRTAFVLKAGGAAIVAIIDLRAEPQGILPAQARAAGIPVLAGHAIVATSGRKRVDSVTAAPMAADGRSVAGAAQRLPCDVVAMSGGWNPAVHLFSQAGGKLRWDEATSAFGPDPSTVPGNKSLACVGAANGTFGLAACIAEGLEAGAAAARVAGFGAGAMPGAPKVDTAAEASARTLWLVPGLHPLGLGSAKRFVDFQNDVTAADLRLAVREGYRSVEHVKRYTTTGMATDQGKLANVTALGIVAEALGESVPAVGTTTFRPPYTPIQLGTLAGRQVGAFFDPVRATPMHAWHARSGCPFEDVGQWKRPWYYPRKGEDLHAAVAREVKAVRARVGVLDASTLGKIDIQGPDAAELLNRVYTNAWSKLEVGRCRYGLMCRDDGMVFDDGVTTRIGPQRFLMTTTTGGAARVLGWLEEWLQTEWPELKVWCTSVTEQWAVAQLAGPQSRAVLQALAPDLDLSGAAFPHMSMRAATVAGLPARVFRISFTGELSYEINVPAGHGLALWEAIMAAGAPLGIVPFGTETMHVMRAEKGFIIVGQETDGSVTPADLGMDWIVSKQKPDFIGKRGMLRTDSLRPDRKQLVGLLTDDPQAVLPEGAQLVEKVLQQPPMAMLGHVTSSYRSPTLDRSIALALVKGGRARLGAKLHAPLMDGRVLAATVVEPVFYDKEGARLAA